VVYNKIARNTHDHRFHVGDDARCEYKSKLNDKVFHRRVKGNGLSFAESHNDGCQLIEDACRNKRAYNGHKTLYYCKEQKCKEDPRACFPNQGEDIEKSGEKFCSKS